MPLWNFSRWKECQEIKLGQHWCKCSTCKRSHFFISLDLCCLFTFCDVNGARGLGNRLHLVNSNVLGCCAHTTFSPLSDIIKHWKERTRAKSVNDLFRQCLQRIYCCMRIFKAGHAFRAAPTRDQFVLNLAGAVLKTERKDTKQFLWQKWLPNFGLKLE